MALLRHIRNWHCRYEPYLLHGYPAYSFRSWRDHRIRGAIIFGLGPIQKMARSALGATGLYRDPIDCTLAKRRCGSNWFAVGLHCRHILGSLYRHGRKRSEEHTSELQSRENLVCRLLLEKKKLI